MANTDLSILVKSFNRLDNYVAKYIYKKYICSDENEGNEGIHEEEYKKYIHQIFSIERPHIITQKESLETDLQNMDIADSEYNSNPNNFKSRQFKSLPDIKRCSFIRKHKNKYKRCANGILNDDSDMCYKHLESPNMYWDRWCEILYNINTGIGIDIAKKNE
jgi:hypothetical protein